MQNFSPPRRNIQAPPSRGGIHPVQTTFIGLSPSPSSARSNNNNNQHTTREVSPPSRHRDVVASSNKIQQQFSPSSRSSAVALLRNNPTVLIGSTTNRSRHFSPSSSSTNNNHHNASATQSFLENEIRLLEEEIVKTKLRGEWANRRIIALETLHNAESQNPKATLFRYERRKIRSDLAALVDREEQKENFTSPGRASGLLPSTLDLHADVATRIEKLEAQSRRIKDQIQEVTTLRDTQEQSHREKVRTLRNRRDNIRERKVITESQIRIAEGEIKDDDELSEKQYKRYCARIEQSRQDSLRRHESSLKVQQERSDARCSMIQKETDDIVNSMKRLVEEKKKELESMSGRENNSYEVASKLGCRVEEVEQAGVEIEKLRKKQAVLEIEENHSKNEIDIINEEIRRAHYLIYELDGKIQISESSDSQKLRSQESKLESLRMSIRSLQERISIASKRRRVTSSSSSSGNNNNYDNNNSTSTTPNTNRSLIMLDTKLDELNQLNHVSRLQIHEKEQELARLSDAYNDLNERLRNTKNEGEYLYARLAKLRHDSAVDEARRDVRARGVVGGTSLTGALAAGSLFSTLAGGR